MWTFYSSVILLSVIQIQHVLATGCNIVSVTSPSASTLNVEWSSYNGASMYLLDFRVVNITNIAPVVVIQTAINTQRLIQGLRPGHVYQVTLEVFQFYTVVCTDVKIAMTVPATSKITFSKAISSTSIRLEWSSAIGADSYILFVEKLFSSPLQIYNQTFTTLDGQVDSLTPSTTYNCYIYSSNSAGRGAKSNTKTIMTLVQPPTGVTLVSTGDSTARVTWNSVSKVLLYQVTVSDDNPSNPPVIRHTSTTSMDISNLEPCSTYTVGVSSVNVFKVSGEASNVIYNTSTINPVATMSLDYHCSSSMVTVTWDLVFGANLYRATAVDDTGASLNCTSASTSCQITMLKCGEKYQVHVTAISDNCESTSSTSTLFDTVPCAPGNPVTIHDCSSNVIVFSWQPTNNTFYYVGTAVDNTGKATECRTADNTCYFTNADCGQVYKYTVYAVSSECNSEVSQPEFVQTSPCLPTNVQTAAECQSHSLITTWDSAAGALSYTVEAQGNTEETYNCTSSSNSCAVTGVPCGEYLSVWIVASNDKCSTDKVLGEVAQTVPCTPTNVSASLDCSQDSARINWMTSIGGVFYIAIAQDTNGNSHSCNSMGTNCLIEGLRCGQNYTGSVISTNLKCNSSASEEVTFMTEPCVPMNLSVHFNVSTAQVMWGAASGASSYSVQAVTDQGSTVTCNTTNTSCFLNGLQCSHIYNVTVMARNMACDGVISETHQLMSEPCPPTNVQASIACEQLTTTVSWQLSELAVGYVAYFDNQNGHGTSCVGTDTDTQCVVSGLMCGTVYSIWVKALGQQYNSSDSTVITLTSAPCLPREVEVEVDCNSDGAAVVSWNATFGTANLSLTAIVRSSLQTLCATQQNSCNMTGLSCGETYNLSLTASNKQCSLTAPMHANLTTRLCPPQLVAVDLQCGSRTAVLSWEERSDVELYVASALKTSGGELQKCNSTGSTCQFPGLDCGGTYNFTVTAHSQGCSSQASTTVFMQTEPCQPVIVSAQALCQSEEVLISWQQASGVVNYLVTATGSLGYVEIHNTTQTLLSAALPCGQDYNVTVQGQGSKCDSLPSSPAFFKTTPCIPRDITTYVQCEFNVGSVSWGPSDGAKTYVAIATGLDGHTHQCLTNNTSCTWNDLHCGEVYTVVVRAKADNCTSLPSNSSVIHMDPCVPQNLVASVNCDMKVVSLSWDASNGAKLYMVSADAGNKSVGLSTNVTTAHFSDFTCGQNYSLTVTPHNQHCPGSSSAPASIQTWPCPPAGVSAMQECLSGIVMVSWQASNGSDYYTATMQTDTGISKMCMSDSNECSVPGLTCGHNFSVSVTASNRQCNITSSQTTSLQSVPCVPTDASVVMDCANNAAVVSWSASQGAVQYSVTAHSSHSNVSCQTSRHNCSLDNLTCGNRYTVQVVAMDDNCSSIPSQALMFNSAPCPPQNVSSEVSCSSNDMSISWEAIREADHFLVSVIAENGGASESCNTTNTACFISNVTCGNTFRVQITSVRDGCHSQRSQTHSILSAPCQPQVIRGNLDCVTNSAWISWDAAPGADSYSVSAVGGEDHTAHCTASSNTTCEVEDLACGILYNFSVTAKASKCESKPSATIGLQTAPCSLSSITAVPQCHNSSILVMWDLMQGSKEKTVYTATAEARDYTYLSCNSTGTSCYLHGARCDLHYTIIVAASSDQCSSMRSPPYRISMEPCPPRNLVVNASCEDHSALVSWGPSPVAETYHVVAMGVDGHVHTCNTTSSNCSVSMLHCDQQYTVFVTASHETCSSKSSQNATLNTGPCQPDGLSVTFHCINQSALLSWTPRDNTVDYYGCAQAGNGDKLCCHSTNSTCTIQVLDCGTVYNFSVQASDGACNSSFSDPVKSAAALCPPDTVEVQLLPMQMETQEMRFNWTQITCSDTEYMLKLTGSLLGDSQAHFELSSYWTSITYFEIPLPCGSSYIASVESRNTAGTSDPSVPLRGTTAPCPPSGVVYSGNSSFATVSWNASVFATSYTMYDISVTPKAQLCSTSGLSCSLSNIASTNLMITASNAAGESEETSVTNVVTQGRRRRDLSEQMPENGGLSAPMLDVNQAMPTVIFVEWSRVDAASHYSLVMRKQGSSSEPQELTVYGESIILSDLSPDSTYCFSVLARNSAASGPESEPVCVQTGQGLPK